MYIEIDFTWHKHPGGYEIKDQQDGHSDTTWIAKREHSEHFLPQKKEEVENYQFTSQHDSIAFEFIACRSEQDFKSFVNKYGLLCPVNTDLAFYRKFQKTLSSFSKSDLAQLNNLKLDATIDKIGNTLCLILKPVNLGQAILIKHAKALSEDYKFIKCAHCGKGFKAGGGKGQKREGSKFCCDKHRQQFNNNRRKTKRSA